MMDRSSEINTSQLAVIGFVSAIVTFVIIVGLQVLYFYTVERVSSPQPASAVSSSESKLATQQAEMSQYGWIDRPAGQLSIPIERAMSLVLEELINAQSKQGEDAADPSTERKDRHDVS